MKWNITPIILKHTNPTIEETIINLYILVELMFCRTDAENVSPATIVIAIPEKIPNTVTLVSASLFDKFFSALSIFSLN